MGRKVALGMAFVGIAIASVVLVGGQVGGGGFLWWGNREPIYIYGDDGFTIENGVLSGCGTASDPYIIEGWRIDGPDADYGIYIDHTTKHFVIRDCIIERTRLAGITFNTVVNGRVESTQIGLSDTAIHLLNSERNAFERNVIAESRVGVILAADSRDNLFVRNSFLDNGLNMHDPQGRNLWCCADGGNYWSDHDAPDLDCDGILDVPYYAANDRRPLASPPIEWTRVAPAGVTYAGSQVAPDGSLVVTSETPISLSAIDPGSGLAAIYYAIDRGEWILYTEPIKLTGPDGPRKVSYYGVDHLGNAERPQMISLLLDNHPPITDLVIGQPKHDDGERVWVTSASEFTLNLVQRSTYGQTETFYRIDGRGWQRYAKPFKLTGVDGPRQITYYSRNASGVTEPMQSRIVYKDDVAPSTRGGQTAPSIGVTIGSARTTESVPQPTPVPAPAPAPDPAPQPVVEPEPTPEPATDPEPIAVPDPTPEPVIASEPAIEPTPDVEPVVEPEPTPDVEPKVQTPSETVAPAPETPVVTTTDAEGTTPTDEQAEGDAEADAEADTDDGAEATHDEDAPV